MENTGKRSFTHFNNGDSQALLKKLVQDFYSVIEDLTTAIQKNATRLQDLEIHLPTSQYIILCNRLVDDIRYLIKNKKEHLIPYLHALFERDTEAHDCRNCGKGGACDLKHDLHLKELNNSHFQIKEILYHLQMASLPLYSETIYPEHYRQLRNQMALLENTLTELYFVEVTYLTPKVVDAQKNIHAGH
jgi:hypothetical protein